MHKSCEAFDGLGFIDCIFIYSSLCPCIPAAAYPETAQRSCAVRHACGLPSLPGLILGRFIVFICIFFLAWYLCGFAFFIIMQISPRAWYHQSVSLVDQRNRFKIAPVWSPLSWIFFVVGRRQRSFVRLWSLLSLLITGKAALPSWLITRLLMFRVLKFIEHSC